MGTYKTSCKKKWYMRRKKNHMKENRRTLSDRVPSKAITPSTARDNKYKLVTIERDAIVQEEEGRRRSRRCCMPSVLQSRSSYPPHLAPNSAFHFFIK